MALDINYCDGSETRTGRQWTIWPYQLILQQAQAQTTSYETWKREICIENLSVGY